MPFNQPGLMRSEHGQPHAPAAFGLRPARGAFKLIPAMAATLILWPGAVSAIEFATGNEDVKLRWDNTFKYSAAYRLRNPSSELTSAAVNPNNVNQDDGDRNFNKGLVSNRIDLFSEVDAAYKNFGARISGAAWYDSVYNRGNDNPGAAGGAFPNQVSVPANEFVDETRKVHGRRGEILDAFVYGNFAISDTSRVGVRLGRHGMVWGETLFFGANGIAGGMMPVDAVKLVSVPNTQFKEAIRPVPMLSSQWQVTADTALAAYYQFRWEKTRIPTVGSYFSVSDALPDGSEQLLVASPGGYLNNAPRLADQKARDSGQGGLQLRTRIAEYDLGAYLIRFHDKTPQTVVNVNLVRADCAFPGSIPTGPLSCSAVGPASYRLAYPEGIVSFGLSASRTFGDVNLALEVSMRRNQPLTSARGGDASALIPGAAPSDNSSNPAYPVGRTAHVNLSTIWSFPRTAWFQEASLAGEIGWNRVLSVTRNANLMDPASTRDAVALRGVLQNNYRQVAPGLDVAPLLGLGWAPKGSRSAITTTSLPQNGNGDVTLGADFTYLDVWRASLAATHYFGRQRGVLVPSGPGVNSLSYQQFSGDRDFVALSVRRSF